MAGRVVHVLIVAVDQEAVTPKRVGSRLGSQAHGHRAALRMRERLANVIRPNRDRPDVGHILLGGIVQAVIDAGVAKSDQSAGLWFRRPWVQFPFLAP